MSVEGSTSRRAAVTASRAPEGDGERLDPLKPLLAGAHARGMADALEMAGVAAIMVDEQGMVLHAGAPARSLFGRDLRIEFDHLVGGDGEATCAIQEMLSKALGPGDLPDPLRLARGDRAPLILRARRVPGAAGNVYQMLKLLIIMEEASVSGTRN